MGENKYVCQRCGGDGWEPEAVPADQLGARPDMSRMADEFEEACGAATAAFERLNRALIAYKEAREAANATD